MTVCRTLHFTDSSGKREDGDSLFLSEHNLST